MGTIFIGTLCEISKAYDHQTGARTMMDEVACMQCEVLELHPRSGEALVWVKGIGEVFITLSRLKRLR